MTDFEAYKMYLALKLHFTTDYDYIKYKGKISVSYATFQKRKDVYFFKKLARVYNNHTLEQFFIANMLVNSRMWVGDAFSAECISTHTERQKKIESLRYMFLNDCRLITTTHGLTEDQFNNVFDVKDGQHPILLRMVIANKINIETFIILNSIFTVGGDFNRQITDTIIWPEFLMRCKKYRPFLVYNTSKYVDVLKKLLII